MKRLSLLLLMLVPYMNISGIIKPSFHDAMSITNQYLPQRAEEDPLWIKIIQLYDNNTFDLVHEGNPQVPHIIHHIWLGSRLPQVCEGFRQTWIDNHPTWTHILWTDDISNYDKTSLILTPRSFQDMMATLSETNMQGQNIIINIEHLQFATRKQFVSSKNFGEKSDILRYEILFHIGGLYVDTDFKCLHPFDPLHQSCNFFAGLDFSDQMFNVFNGLIGSSPQHPICRLCIRNIRKQSLDREDTGNSYKKKIAIMERTGPYFFSAIIRDYIMRTDAHDPIVLFPVTFLYPYPHLSIPKYGTRTTAELENIFLKPESLAIHFWHVSWDPAKKPKK